MSPPSIMVVLPTLGDRLEYLERALDSCRGLMEFADVTLSVVTPERAREARVLAGAHGARVIDDPSRGMSAAINVATEARREEKYYIWLGDDDELVPEGIQALVAALEDDPHAVVAHGYCDYIDEAGQLIGANRVGPWAARLIAWGPNLVPHPGTVVRFDALAESGGFDETLSFVMDLDMFLRLRSKGQIIHRRVVASRFRWHPNSATVADRISSSREAILVKRKYLPPWLRFVSPLWNHPVAWASQIAAWAVTLRARTLDR